MSAAPRVSVVIASYNHAPYVGEAIRSVLAQSFQDFEIVVVDDGSRDGTPERVREIIDPRLTLEVFEANRGACAALNRGLELARGEFVAILNSDDRFLPGKLERQVAFLDAHPEVAAVFGYPRIVDERGEPFSDAAHKDFAVFMVENRDRHAWLRQFFDAGNCLCHPTLLIRRHCYDTAGRYDARLAQVPDLDMWIRLALHYQIHVIAEPLIEFRIRDGQQNASAARPEVLVRDAWERQKVLAHYLRLNRAELAQVFPEYAQRTDPPVNWLVERALGMGTPFHTAFALDAAFAALPPCGSGPGYAPFIRSTGGHDLFQLMRLRELEAQLAEARAERGQADAAAVPLWKKLFGRNR